MSFQQVCFVIFRFVSRYALVGLFDERWITSHTMAKVLWLVAASLLVALWGGSVAGAAVSACPVSVLAAIENTARCAGGNTKPPPRVQSLAAALRSGAEWASEAVLGQRMPIAVVEGLQSGGFGLALLVADRGHFDDEEHGTSSEQDSVSSATLLLCSDLAGYGATCSLGHWQQSHGTIDETAAALAATPSRGGASRASHSFLLEHDDAATDELATDATPGEEDEDVIVRRTQDATTTDPRGSIRVELRHRGHNVGSVAFSCRPVIADGVLEVAMNVTCRKDAIRNGVKQPSCNTRLASHYLLRLPSDLATATGCKNGGGNLVSDGLAMTVQFAWPLRMFIFATAAYAILGWIAAALARQARKAAATNTPTFGGDNSR
jgi:hypothetical protein